MCRAQNRCHSRALVFLRDPTPLLSRIVLHDEIDGMNVNGFSAGHFGAR